MKVLDDSVSVIVQGKIDNIYTQKCLRSIRQYLPNSEVILSTWDYCDVNGLEYDKLVLSSDPGFFYYSLNENDKINNINRQLLTTVAALKVATKNWVLKLRSDFVLNGNNFLFLPNNFKKSLNGYQVFKNKIVACSYFSRNPRYSQYVFHPSDIAFFGLKDDLLNLYDIPFMTKEEAYYLTINGIKYNKYVPEQYLFVTCLRKNLKNIEFSDQLDLNDSTAEETEKYFVSNFVFYSWNELNLIAPSKFDDFITNDYLSCITHVEWLRLYKKYIDNEIIIPNKDIEREKLTKIAKKLEIIDQNYISHYVKAKKLHKLISNIVALPFLGDRNKGFRNRIRKSVINTLKKIN